MAQEFLNALGLYHAFYTSCSNNVEFRSVMEDKGPILEVCGKKIGFEAELLCRDVLGYPTDVDIMILIDLYGNSYKVSDYCTGMRDNFLEKYPMLVVQTDDYDGVYNLASDL